MSALRGFGLTFDIERGMARSWYVGTDGVTRWADDDQPVRCPKCDNPSRVDCWHVCKMVGVGDG